MYECKLLRSIQIQGQRLRFLFENSPINCQEQGRGKVQEHRFIVLKDPYNFYSDHF